MAAALVQGLEAKAVVSEQESPLWAGGMEAGFSQETLRQGLEQFTSPVPCLEVGSQRRRVGG